MAGQSVSVAQIVVLDEAHDDIESQEVEPCDQFSTPDVRDDRVDSQGKQSNHNQLSFPNQPVPSLPLMPFFAISVYLSHCSINDMTCSLMLGSNSATLFAEKMCEMIFLFLVCSALSRELKTPRRMETNAS